MKITRKNKNKNSKNVFFSRRSNHINITMKRKNHITGGGTANTNMAVIAFVRNIASQIINSIETKLDYTLKNTKYFNLSDDKKSLYAPLYHEMNMNYDKFKYSAGIMINERNDTTHPQIKDIRHIAKICRDLIMEHNLAEKLSFELKILQSVINPKRVTRSMSLRHLTDDTSVPEKTMTVNNRWGR